MSKLPYDVLIEYMDGSTGTLAIWAEDMKTAVADAAYWLVQHVPAIRVTVSLRTETG
jgi:hypothetical protein